MAATDGVAQGAQSGQPTAVAGVPRLARPFVVLFLAAIVSAVIFNWEPWPITSFRLFSHLREDQQSGWAAASIASDGREAPLAVADLAPGLRGFGFRMAEFETASWSRRDEICRAWLAPLIAEAGEGRAEIRLFRVSRQLSQRIDNGRQPAPPSRTLAFVCTPVGAQEGAAG